MHPNINDVNNQNIHVEVDARVRMSVRQKGQKRTTKGVRGRYLQNDCWRISVESAEVLGMYTYAYAYAYARIVSIDWWIVVSQLDSTLKSDVNNSSMVSGCVGCVGCV